jgi:Arc/MetJ-type ribon-helix-helix transcriptional regulator
MTIHLPRDVEKSLMAKVRSGVFPSLDVAMTEAAHLLLEQIEQARPAQSPTKEQRKRRAKTPRKALSVEDFHQKLLAEGRVSRLPDTAADFDDPDDQPVTIKGEPLSETIIRERR